MMTTEAIALDTTPPETISERRRAIVAAVAGTVLEYYDFAVYGYLAVFISPVFFPSHDDLSSLLLTVATFGVGFFMRPVGAIVLGSYADRAGRKAGLTLTITLMALGTAIVGLSPSYATIGIAAPLFLVLGRLLQGFAAGGELGSATAFLIEHATEGARGRYASFQQVSQGGALVSGSLVSAAMTGLLTPDQMTAWGWRVPFILGLIILPVGLYLRSRIQESPGFLALKAPSERPVRGAIATHPGQLAVGFGATITWTVCTYILLIYMPTFAIRQLALPASTALVINAAGVVAVMVVAYLAGTLSDRIGRKAPMLVAAGLLVVTSYPIYSFIVANTSILNLCLVQIFLGAVVGLYTGPAPAFIGEMFPVAMRSSGFSLAYNFAVTIFGGFAPFIVTWLIGATGSKLAPSFYVMAGAAVSIVALLASRRKPSPATLGASR